jgi:hypothetical protein
VSSVGVASMINNYQITNNLKLVCADGNKAEATDEKVFIGITLSEIFT